MTPDRTTRHVGAGLTMAAVVGLFSYGGHLLDERTGLSPVFLLVGMALGSVGGFIHLVSVVAPEMLPFQKKKPPSNEESDGTGSR